MSSDLQKYRPDPDLDFLQRCDQADLDIVVTYLTKTKNGDIRVAETLTQEPRYKEFQPDHAKYWDLVAAELQHFGGNTFANLGRRLLSHEGQLQ